MKPLAIANGFTMFSSSNSIWCKDTVFIYELCKFLDEYLHGCIILVQIVWRIAFFVLPLRLNSNDQLKP
jgi:hypothetical protein